MFTQQPDFLKKIAARVGRVPFLKRKLRNMYDYYINSITGHRNALFHKNGIKVLKAFDECLTSNGFTYTLAFGTMLGAIREQGFIPHDLDIDVAMWTMMQGGYEKSVCLDAMRGAYNLGLLVAEKELQA